jgi:transcriptional repressor NrdR
MKCLRCGHGESKVLESRITNDHKSIRRRRTCLNCERRFTTFEKEETLVFFVKKKDSHVEPFQKDKAIRSLKIACQKRNISIAKLEFLVGKVEVAIHNLGEKIVSSRLLGDMLLQALRELDQVAYVRFASVYKDFKDPKEFSTLLKFIDKQNSIKNP